MTQGQRFGYEKKPWTCEIEEYEHRVGTSTNTTLMSDTLKSIGLTESDVTRAKVWLWKKSMDLSRVYIEEDGYFFLGEWVFVCYESTKRELKNKRIYECLCDERLKTKDEGSTRLTYTGLRGDPWNT